VTHPEFDASALRLDAAREIDRIARAVEAQVFRTLRRRGAVVGLSGGVDSSVTAALLVRALGRERVLGLLMPEAESSGDALRLGRLVADSLGVEAVVEEITPLLSAARCYERRDEAIRRAVPDYGPGYRCKVVLPSVLSGQAYRVSQLVVRAPDGTERRVRLDAEAYHGLVAATNFKQRTRKMLEYYHADRLRYAVAGTPNRLEYDQGFFVKLGDGAADLKPIAHLYKTQVYRLAEALGVPAEVRARVPTTDTFPLEQTQEEFYFPLPYGPMDLCLLGKNRGLPPERVAPACGLAPEQVALVYADIDAKRRATRYLHLPPLLVEAIPGVPSPLPD
jgi:NAD+ synthase